MACPQCGNKLEGSFNFCPECGFKLSALTEKSAQGSSSINEEILVYFHAVISKEFHLEPEKDMVVLKSEVLFGSWDGFTEMFPSPLGDNQYRIEGQYRIPKEKIQESIPYKYAVYKKENGFIYETIYQKGKNDFINRCLTITPELLTAEGEWHQYDDMIHPKLKSNWLWNSTEQTVIDGRNFAGGEMLKIIFDLLKTWNDQKVEEFFSLLEQFFYTYSSHLLHDGRERRWGLPYDSNQVNSKNFILQQVHVNLSLTCLTTDIFHLYKRWVADTVETLCHTAMRCRIEKWVLVIPLVHLLRGESKPYEPVPPVLNPQFDSWTGLKRITRTDLYDASHKYALTFLNTPKFSLIHLPPVITRVNKLIFEMFLLVIYYVIFIFPFLSAQDTSTMSKLMKIYDFTKFLKLMSVVVMESWPKDENGHEIQDEDLVFDYLMSWPMAKTILKIAGAGEGLTDKLSDEALSKIDLGRSAFKSVSKKFLSGEIQIKGLLQILQRKQEFLDFLKIGEYNYLFLFDLNGLDKKLKQNFETMNLSEFMKVHTLDGLNSSATANVTYFNLCDETHQMASDIHAIKDSGIFKMCWTNQVEVLTRDKSQEGNSDRNQEIYTFEQVYNKIFQTCYTNFKRLYVSLKSGELLLEETDSIFKAYKGKYEDLEKDLNIMCRVDPSDDKTWISERVNQIQQYQDIHLARETSKIVMDIKNIICPEGDFSELKKLLQMNEPNFKKNNLSYIDDAFLHAKNILKDISDDRKECLQTLVQSKDFIQWTKKELKDINELKVFVDLASISAGENDMDVDRVACLHDAVLGYSSMLYDLKQDSDFAKFNESLKKLWKALDNDQNIPKKLWDTSRHLEWLKSVRESHGSVEFSSLSLATSVNNRGIYIIKAQDQQQNSLTLQIDDSHKNMTYTYEDLKELQNKLMLMSGKKQQNQSEVERFTEVFDNIQRFTKAFVDIYTAGNPIFRCWEAKIYCKTQSDPCIVMEIKFCKTQYCFKVTGSLAEQLVALSKKMEKFLGAWQEFMDKQRTGQYYLNYFTAQQIFYLCSVLTPTNINTEIEDRALMMLSFIKPNCTTLDVQTDEADQTLTRDCSLRREFPKGLNSKQPNLIICPHDEVLTSSICLYMNDYYGSLPTYDEVLLCSPSTSYEQVELFLRRCLTPGDIGRKIYSMLWADQLSYDVSCAMEKCFQKLCSPTNDYRLVIFCSSDREHTYIPTAFSQYKTDFVPQEPLEKIQQYLSRHYTVTSDYKNAVFKGGHSLGIVASSRAGVGKSLYVQRLYEKLERSVDEGKAFKKCIRLTEHEVDDHKILQFLYDTPKQKDIKVFHFDVTSSVQKGLNEFIFKLFFLRYLMDSNGQMWQCSQNHLYVIELLESTNDQNRCDTRLGRNEHFTFSDVFPKLFCHPPKKVMALEMQKEENPDMDCSGPLMDDECFRSEAYQRPYQYLTRFHNKDNLDNFTFQGTEGTHAKCLQILLIYCGIIDPSWAELRNFVWFLNLQLKDCENSDFCKFELVGDTLCGFKNFVVEFMILMSKDFATPSLCITDQSPGKQQVDISGLKEKDLAPFLIRKRWESEPHPYIFFNDDHMSMTFIGFHLKPNNQKGFDAVNPLTKEVIKKNIMTRQLYNGLKLQRVPFNTDFDQFPRADKIEHLCSVLGVKWPTDPDETYELTTDNILKMMAIHMRFRCGIPVIIMGETGCGKTRLIKFMCELRRCGAPAENMKLVKIHGGTTSEIIYEKVKEAETLARTNKENHDLDSVLFFDEANTTEAVNSIKEILCDNSVQGEELGSNTGLYIIAACNPYRKHTDQMIKRLEASGLGYRVRAEETEDRLGSIPLRQLVYRVHVLPPSMIPLVWDFGQLNDSTEQIYIEQIVQRQAKASFTEKDCIPTIIEVLSSSQKFMRERKDECSFVSLRDVERCMQGFLWFYNNHPMFAEALKAFLQQQQKNNPPFSPASDRILWSLLMATGMCYQSCLENKDQYQKTISQIFPDEYTPQRVLQEMELMQDLLLNRVPMGETIARNEALKENFFMMVVCIELRIPLFIVGKPGSSKSLSKTLVANAMQGPTSHSDLYKKLKQIHLVSFQCSPHSTPEGIINTFKQCARFQESKNLDEYISVVVLDEIGLAEDSPKMPLKALHPLLEEGCVDDEPKPHKRVGFIGISNWALDPAKMNRGIFVSRGDLNEQELIKSARGICSSDQHVLRNISHLFQPLATAYMTVCDESNGFFGLRDFYSLIKMLFSITKTSNEPPKADQITRAVLQNFSGKNDDDVIDTFRNELRDDFANVRIPTIDLVKQSICPASQMEESRYLLLLTKNYAALQILQQIFCSHQICPEIIFGSSFPKDQEYTQICRNINRVKVCMETGQTVVLLNLQNLYESLYDALNQYYVTLGGQNYVDLGLGTHRVKCRVHQNFRLIVIEEREVVYEQFPIPLINRLEKHYLDINTVLTEEQKVIARQLEEWVKDFVSLNSYSSEKEYDPSDVFIGYHSDTCSSVVMQVTERESTETDAQVTLNKAKDILLNCATPDSVVRLDKSKLPTAEREHLMQEYVKEARHSSLGDYIVYHIQQPQQSHVLFTEVTTFSRLLTATDTQQLQNQIKLDAVQLLSLQQFDTEYSFLKKIREFLGSTLADKVLIIQAEYDEGSHRRNILSSAKYSCFNEINKYDTTDDMKTFVYFVIKLPRMEGGTTYVGFQGGPWRSVHIDDLRRSKEFVSDVLSLKNQRISDLFEDPPEGKSPIVFPFVLEDAFDTIDLVRSCVQSAVSMLRDEVDSGEFSTKRVENLCMNISFRHTLWRKIQAVVTPLLAYLVSIIDRDCNMDLLLDDEEDIRNLWLEIFGNKEMLNWTPLPSELPNSLLMVQSHITGGHTMCCRMPFSWWIKDFLDGLMMQARQSKHQKHSFGDFHDLFLKTPLGTYMAKNVNEKLKKEFFKKYLQDFVSMTMKVASDEKLELLCQAMASCVDEIQRQKRDDELSLPLIHIAYHFCQSRLQNLSRMISLHTEIVSPLQRNQQIRRCPEMVLDVYAAKACVESLEPCNLESDTHCQHWLRKVKKVQASLELICSQNNLQQYGEHCKKVLRDVSHGWKRIYILSLFVEHLMLGFQNEDNQLRTLVLNHIKTLSRAVETHSDVKSTQAFEAVVEVLKSCKQGATNQIFRFGGECGVCMREPLEPVGLPCYHIYCLTCIKESLDAGPAFCPTCRQQLPDDFQPHVSEDTRASIKKNAGFRQRCNGFFIDLLSTMCFKDNTPPDGGVIAHLFSYLMTETDQKEIHTKALSPFDESPDKNPVVRSVILKLLLKFSFEEVMKYLQQHLSSVEESRFVDDVDKTELYALYINCLEDSIWEKMPQEGNKAAELQCFINETQFLQSFLAEVTSAPATVSIQHLQHIARLRVTLIMASQLISDRLSGTKTTNGAEDFLNMVIKLCKDSGNNWYRVYLIRKLSESQGVEYVQTMVKQPEFFWLFPEEILQQVLQQNRTVFLLLALFREVTTLYRSENRGLHPTPKQCNGFDDLINGSRYLPQTEVRNFASALIYNRLGALTIQPGNTIEENTVIELIIHLAAVLLRGDHPLLMPLKHIGLSPENMQVNSVIVYKMIDLATCKQFWELLFQNSVTCFALGGDQLYFLLMQICCFRDQTRPGHILGDPQRRNNPDALDTKNMSLTPFTLVRLVTHLAMMLGASEKPQVSSNLEIIQPPVEDVSLFLRLHIIKDLEQLSQALGKGADDTVTSVHLVLRSLQELPHASNCKEGSEVDSSAVWSCRERLSLLSLTHIMETNDQKEELPLLWRFLQKEREFRHIKFLPEILMLQKRLVRKYQNATEEIAGSIREFIDHPWYQKHIETFLKTWNELRVSVTGNEIKIPEEFCSRDLDLDSNLRYLLPRRQGPGLCATGLVSYLVTLHNELVNAVDRHTGEDNSNYTVSLSELMEQHVISYDVEKDLFPLVLSNCQYSLERGHETISEYDLPRIQQQILTRFLQGKPLITRAGIPTLVNTQERDYETIFKTVHGKVPQNVLTSMAQNTVSRQLDSYSEVCEALQIVELLLGFLSMTGGDPTMKLNKLFISFLSSLSSEKMLQLKRVSLIFADNKTELKGFMSRGNVDQWLLEMHEFLLLRLGRPRATEDYNPKLWR
uniref:RING-type E3 ubiquitin transferase n=1 Tax=Neolamprologus brichardi TaxID=32507 RepID=A0A3Q4I5J3_NEOBR